MIQSYHRTIIELNYISMAASAPLGKLCTTCDELIDDSETKQEIEYLKFKFGDVEAFQEYLIKYKINPDSIVKCILCERVNWQKIKNKNISNERKSWAQKNTLKNSPKNSSWIFLVFVMLVVGVFIQLWASLHYYNGITPMISEDELKFTITKLKDQFPSLQRGLLKKIGGALTRLKSPGEPFVLLLLHDDTNKKTTDCLASYTSIVAKQNIFNDTPKSLWMDASEWAQYSTQDVQEILHEKLIVPLEKNKVLVLENLQDLPWSMANFLHYLCDLENPQIKKAMYILQLKVNEDNLNQLSDGEKLIVAEDAMNTAWMDGTNSFRAALISRLTSYVDAVLLKSDEECSNDKFQPMQSEINFIKISP